MAAIQRKLVHKQFNSPMGLYSQENVKATLNRELKAFGADGIEIDEQITKPLNLANSAVLRAVEEEEQQIKCGDFYARPRQSRSRQRDGIQESLPPHHAPHQQLLDQIKSQYLSHQHDVVIDRETVLRINRMSTRRQLPKRDHSWPPTEQEALHSPAVTPATTPTHSIEALREKFNSPTRIVEPTVRELRQQRLQLEPKSKPKQQQQQQQQQRQRQSRADASSKITEESSNHPSISPLTPQARGFSAPETKAADADLGLVAPKCEYYEQLTQQRPATPTAKASTPSYRPRLKRQSYSLDRGRARKRAVALGVAATELPPQKPRNGNGSGCGSGSGNGTPKVQRRSIKLATELQISYDTDHGNDGDSEEEPKVTLAAAAAATAADIDLEMLPLPATPSERAAAAAASKLMTKTQNASLPRKGSTLIDSLAVKQQQQMALAIATATPDARAHNERIIPITVLAETPSTGQQEASAQDSHNMTDDAAPAPPATYVSATSGIKLQRQDSASASKYKTQLSQASSIPTPPPLPPPPPAPLLQLRARSRQEAKDMQARRQGGIFDQVAQSADSQVKQHEAHVEIAQLEAKYAHIQQSIAEHLRQIDAYMENAKTALQRTAQMKPSITEPAAPPTPPAPSKPISHSHSHSHNSNNNELWDMFASRQSPILAVESPLQAILRQIYCRAAGIQLPPKEQLDSPELHLEPAMPAENVPIVERALEDLHRIAIALDSDGHVEHKMTPTADKAQHVVIEEEQEEVEQQKQEQQQEQDSDFSLDYRHVSDVIANYEQLSAATTIHQEQQPLSADKRNATQAEEQLMMGKERRAVKCLEQQESKKADTKTEVKSIKQVEEEEIEQEKILKEIRKEQQREKLRELLQKQEKQLKEQVELLREQQKQKLKVEQEQEKQKLKVEQEEELKVEQQEKLKMAQEEEQQKQPQSNDQLEAKQSATPTCPHEASETEQQLGSWCAVCGECRHSPHGWGKLNKADQWRLDNLQNESLANYKSTYEIRSPYISRQISWEDTQQQQQQQESRQPLQRQRSEVEIITTPVAVAAEEGATTTAAPASLSLNESKDWQLSRSPSPLPLRKYPAPLIDTAQRCSSPFGLNAVQLGSSTPTQAPLEAKFTHVPQLEGHNIGLLVHTATEPLQTCMSASSSMLAATPPATPRCNSQPPPFEFLMQHGLGVDAQRDAHFGFKSLAGGSSEELPRERSVNRSFDNVSPRPYIGIEGYKRVAWPPASEERIVREFTPQPQTQSPAPGSGGYYPQPVTATAAAAASQPTSANAAPAQGAIYNNVQPRTQQQPQPKPQPQQHYQQQYQQQQQQQPHQQPAQNVYGPSTNYAAPATVAAASPANNYNYPQQPIQYTQAQFNRQPSREPTVEAQYPSYPQQQQQQQQPQQQQQYEPSYQQQQQQPHRAVNNVGVGWKHIGPPTPKTHREFSAGGVAPYQQQQQQQQYQQQQPPQQQYGAPSNNNYQQQQPQQQQPAPQQWQQQQQQPQQQQQYQAPYQTSPYQQQQNYSQQNGGANYAQPQYNSYSQPQQHQQQQQEQQQQQLPYSLDQTDQQHGYRGASPGIITLRKEAPVSQKPAPVYTSQPAAVSYQGGSKLRGDLKWPPQEYKEAAVRENEERRLLALGPVCRPRRVNRDYTPFFAKHQLNHAYPSYKVPPGTQHMFV